MKVWAEEVVSLGVTYMQVVATAQRMSSLVQGAWYKRETPDLA